MLASPNLSSPTLNMALWEHLSARADRWHAVADLVQRFAGNERVLHREVAALQAFGYGIEWHPYQGVRYLHPADRLCPDQIQWKLNTQIIGRRLCVWNCIDSTQRVAKEAAGNPINQGLVVLAESQTAGRGRRGRNWIAPPYSSILASVLVFPPPPMREHAWLTAWAAVAVGQIAEELCRRNVQIKWPNDVLLGRRKLAGILVEQFGNAFVVGIGLNVDLTRHALPPELRATAASLAEFAARPLDRSDLAWQLLQRLDALYLRTRRCQGGDDLWDWWQQRSTAGGEASCTR